MSDDRRMLELAAKAAGMTLGAWSDNRMAFMYRDASPGPGYWNPLASDGDALRLAVTLGLQIRADSIVKRSATASWVFDSCGEPYDWVVQGFSASDPYAATRRAIVRAAAAMAPEVAECEHG